ncbi:glycosyltransferase [Limibacter armeniacum]|uniref:glycosyltransferase n=1 Tax=Limibacter armeniacum TaxID=466084 RepID=UPI002FE66AFC
MKILLASIGTRGDMEPFLALGEILQKQGHDIICLFPAQFRSLAEDSGFRFTSLGTAFIEMLDSKEGKAALGGGGTGLQKMAAYIKLATRYKNINKELVELQYKVIEEEKPDRIIHNGKMIYPILWGMKNKDCNILVYPMPYVMHYAKEHAHVAFDGDYGPFFNKLTYSIASLGLVQTILSVAKQLKISDGISRKKIKQALFNGKTIYTISPSLFSKPDYWDKHVKVLGYHERDKTVNWTPDKALEDFVGKHDKILLVTFGSMTNPNPAEKTKMILDVLQKNGIPAIINTFAGGLVEPEAYDKNLIHFVSQIPYDWAFPKMYGVVHHGGSGTSHMAVKYGCVSLIIPHIIDQFLWNDILSKKGVGPKGPAISKLKANVFQEKVLDLWQNKFYKENALKLSAQMQSENFGQEIIEMVEGKNGE